MSNKRKVEVFSAGCPVCNDVVDLVKASACPSCEVTVLDTNDIQVAQRAKAVFGKARLNGGTSIHYNAAWLVGANRNTARNTLRLQTEYEF